MRKEACHISVTIAGGSGKVLARRVHIRKSLDWRGKTDRASWSDGSDVECHNLGSCGPPVGTTLRGRVGHSPLMIQKVKDSNGAGPARTLQVNQNSLLTM